MKRQEVIEIEPDNADAFRVFATCATQWRVGFSGRTGLDYTAVRSVMDLEDVEDQKDCFWRVRVIEIAALSRWGELNNG